MKTNRIIAPFIIALVGICTATQSTQAAALSQRRILRNIDYVVAGVAGVGGGSGTITISGVTGPVTQAFLYWHGIGQGIGATYFNPNVTINETPITGTALGDAPTNTWGPGSSRLYEADVTAAVPGNGAYFVTGLSSCAG